MSHSNYTSTGCPAPEVMPHDPVPFFSNGEVDFKAHDVGWLVCGVLTVISVAASFWLIGKHLSFFYHPHEQRHIVRLLLMPPIYAVCSFLSYFYYDKALYFQVVRDGYEALVIASFFFLLLSYLSNPPPTSEKPHPQPFATRAERNAQLRSVVKELHLKKWMWPFGRIKWRPAGGGPGEGEAFLWWMRVGIGQYVLVRPLSTLASVIGEATGYYCLASWSPKFVHVWSSAAIFISVSIAMYAVLQLYMPLRKPLAPYQPVLKFLCVKLVVFFMFWQESALSWLVSLGWIKSRTYFSAHEIVVGLSALLACFEMVVFSFLHVKAFTYLPYRALAAPAPLDGSDPRLPFDDDDDDLDEKKLLDPSKSLTFAEWDALDRKAKAREKALSRLAKTKLPKHAGESGLPITKADGTPILQRTKRWPALLKCLSLSDIAREIKEETLFIFRGGKLDELGEELLVERRKDDLEAAMGNAREGRKPRRGGAARADTDAYEEEETPFERDLRRLREGGDAPRGAKVGADGSLLFAPTHPSKVHVDVFDPRRGVGYEQGDRDSLLTGSRSPGSRWAGIEERERQQEEAERRKDGWWGSWRKYGSRGRRQAVDGGTFEQLPRVDYNTLPVADIPTLADNSSLPLPAPHQLGTPPPGAQSRDRPLHLSPPRQRSTLDPPAPSSPQRQSPSSASSNDSAGHLPRESLRPASYVPLTRPAKTPSPPPFSHFRRQSHPPLLHPSPAHPVPAPISPPAPTDGFTAYFPASSRFRRQSRILSPAVPSPTAFAVEAPQLPQPVHSRPRMHTHSQSVPVVAVPSVAVPAPLLPTLVMANPESRRSKGLPPGAAPAATK
ncbi:hypothetical protein JCM6882_004289 [Rhodosporidiobolus microsporus]